MIPATRHASERERLLLWLAEDLGDEFDEAVALCCHRESGRPLYFSHVALALNSWPDGLRSDQRFDNLERAYVYLIAAYYILDAIVDGHPCHGSQLPTDRLAPFLPVFVALSTRYFMAECGNDAAGQRDMHLRLVHSLTENRTALRLEIESRNQLFVSWAIEHFHMWARSNCFLFLFHFAAFLNGDTIEDRLLLAGQQLLVLIQRGDDSCDWREDFQTRSFTPFLRKCFTALPSSKLNMATLEEYVYLHGAMEDELALLKTELALCRDSLSQCARGGELASLAEYHRLKVSAKYDDLASIRLEVI